MSDTQNKFLPKPEIIIQLYEALARGEVPELKWKNPGRYLPDDYKEKYPKKREKLTEKKKNKVLGKEKSKNDMKNFDFEEFNKFDMGMKSTSYNSNSTSKNEFDFAFKAKNGSIGDHHFPTTPLSDKKKKKPNAISFDDVLKDVMKHSVWLKEETNKTCPLPKSTTGPNNMAPTLENFGGTGQMTSLHSQALVDCSLSNFSNLTVELDDSKLKAQMAQQQQPTKGVI